MPDAQPPTHAEIGTPGQSNPPVTVNFETTQEPVKLQYELLGILDSKASALLTFDALALTTLSIWLGYIPLNFMHASLDLVFILLLVSCFSLLIIIWLRWAKVHDDPAHLNAVRVLRTRCYRLAWVLSLASISLIVVVSCIHTFGTVLIATNSCGSTCQDFYSQDVFGNLDYSAR